MSEQTMIERVARALCKADDRFDGAMWRTYTDHASAAIEAMREPTPSMTSAGMHAYSTSKHIWRAMIDAALREQQQ
jgi:hypothetical protein